MHAGAVNVYLENFADSRDGAAADQLAEGVLRCAHVFAITLLETVRRRGLRPAGKRKGSSGIEGILVHDPAMPATRAAKLLRLKLRQEGPQRTHTVHDKQVQGCGRGSVFGGVRCARAAGRRVAKHHEAPAR